METPKRWIWGCLSLLMIVYCLPVRADIELRSERITTADGLANNSIRHLYQDSKGFIWMATLNGLNRYDGNSFVTFRPQTDKEISLADHRVKVLEEDKNGFLWITSSADQISCYDLRHGCFVDYTGCGEYREHYRGILQTDGDIWLWGVNGCRRVTYSDGQFSSEAFNVRNKSLKSDEVRFVQEGKDRIWIGTSQGAYYWKSGKLMEIDGNRSFWKLLSYQSRLVFVTSDGALYAFQEGEGLKHIGDVPHSSVEVVMTGLFRIGCRQYILTAEGTWCLDMLTLRLSKVSGEYDIVGGRVSKDSRKNYWIYNQSGKLYMIEAATGRLKVLDVMPREKLGFIDKERYYIAYDERGIVWISTYGNGLFAYVPRTDELHHYTAASGLLGSDYLQGLLVDRSGAVWVSAEFAGLSKLDIKPGGAARMFLEENKQTDRSNMVRMINSTSDGDIWIGTRTGGLYIYDSKLENRKKKFHHNINTYAVCEDMKGVKWVATRGEGLWVDDTVYRHDRTDARSLSSDNVFSLLKDRKGRMWVGTFGGGLNLAVPKPGGGYEFRKFFQRSNAQKEVRVLCLDTKGRIWVGTSEGVFVFHPDDFLENSTRYKQFSLKDGSLRSNDIRSIICDKQGRLWIAESGYGIGLSILSDDYERMEFTHYSSKDGLVNTMVQALMTDDEGRLWISTEYGLSCFDPSEWTFENYMFSDDILGNVYSENSALKMDDGRLLFGTGQGVVIVDPKQTSVSKLANTVVFTDFKLDGVSVRPGDNGSPLDTELAYSDKVELAYNQRSFVVEFANFDYSGTDLLKYSYKLDKYDDDWSAPSSLNFAAYKNLSPGIYRLRVKVCNEAGVWSPDSVLEIEIVPPFWKTWWAFLLYILTGVVALYVAFRVAANMNALRNKIKVEEQLIEYKLMFFTNISHEFRTPLTLIQGALERIHRAQSIPDDMKDAVRLMDKSTVRMMRLINQLLEFRKMQHNKLRLSLEETDVVEFLHDIYCDFGNAARSKRMDFTFQSSEPSFFMYVDRSKLDKIAYNLLSNAFKYTPAGRKIRMDLRIDTASGKFTLQVTDTGVGVPPAKRGELFKRFMQSNFSASSMGVGLHLTHELVMVHKGEITYTENPEGGSVFTVTLPLDSSIYASEDFLAFPKKRAELETVILPASSDEDKAEEPDPVPAPVPVSSDEDKAEEPESAPAPVPVSSDEDKAEEPDPVPAPVPVSSDEDKAEEPDPVPAPVPASADEDEAEEPDSAPVPAPAEEEELEDLTELEEYKEYRMMVEGPALTMEIEVDPENKRKILVVEDDNDVREFLVEELSPYFEVVAESDGLSGLERAKVYDADLIVSDVLMPGCSGFELTQKLKSDFQTSHIPIILLTALDSQEKHLEGVEAGADAYITKPFGSNLLKARIFKLIEQRDRLRDKFSQDPEEQTPTLCSNKKDRLFLDKLAAILEEHLSDSEFTIDDFISRMGMGRTVFYRKVKGVTGYSPNEYIRVMRMKRAADMLMEGFYTVSEVAYQVGLSDPFYFSKCFKAQFGVTPSQYQKGKRQQEADK